MAEKRTSLKVLRVKNDLTQVQFAERIGVSRMQYSSIENGKTDGSVEFWKKVQSEFNLSDAEMWGVMNGK